jgi:hypothetical protein
MMEGQREVDKIEEANSAKKRVKEWNYKWVN